MQQGEKAASLMSTTARKRSYLLPSKYDDGVSEAGTEASMDSELGNIAGATPSPEPAVAYEPATANEPAAASAPGQEKAGRFAKLKEFPQKFRGASLKKVVANLGRK